jgi:excisionase family DNA binding protein
VIKEPTEHHALRERLMTPREVACVMQVSPDTVIDWAQAKKIPSTKTPGGHYRFRPAVIAALVAGDADISGPADVEPCVGVA